MKSDFVSRNDNTGRLRNTSPHGPGSGSLYAFSNPSSNVLITSA
jgi:hypothetical protein